MLPRAWTLEGRTLRHFTVRGDEWTFLNLAPRDSRGSYKSGPDLVFHDGQDALVIVELKVARAGGVSVPQMFRQVFAYGLQARQLLDDPSGEVRQRSSRTTGPTFAEVCEGSGFRLTGPTTVVLALVTMKPEGDNFRSKGLASLATPAKLGNPAFQADLRAPRSGDPSWQERILAKRARDSSAFTWSVLDDVPVGDVRAINLRHVPARSSTAPGS